MREELQSYLAMAEALGELLHPYGEIVIHDLIEHKIAAIINNYSGRNIGDASQIEDDTPIEHYPDHFKPHFKRNDKGHKIKSTSVTIREKGGRPVGLFCVNVDVEAFDAMKQSISTFVEGASSPELPARLFKEDWQERIHRYVVDYLQKNYLSLDSLKKDQRLVLIQHLLEDGAFNSPKSADYVANVLSISRATVYNDLAKLDKQAKPS